MSPRGDGGARHAAPALPPCPGLVRRRDSRSQGQRRACPSCGLPHGSRQLRPRRGAAGAQRCRRSVPALRRDSDAPPAERGPFTPRRIKVSLQKKNTTHPGTRRRGHTALPARPPHRARFARGLSPVLGGRPPAVPQDCLLRPAASRAAPGAAAPQLPLSPRDAWEPRAARGAGRATPGTSAPTAREIAACHCFCSLRATM